MNKLLAIATLTLLSVSLYSLNQNTVDYQAKFEQWKVQYNKNYSPSERSYRQAIYEQNLMMIEAHNADSTQTYTMGENQFADLSQEEFVEKYLTLKVNTNITKITYLPTHEVKSYIDWSTLTRVKDQGECGSGYIFSAIGAIESMFRVKGMGTSDDLSEQQMLDCHDYHCDGGDNGYLLYLACKMGVVKESLYPYVGFEQICQMRGLYKPNNYYYVYPDDLESAISAYPVAVSVDATNWQFYKTGIFKNCNSDLNHAALAVGYFSDQYWIIKNSWGKTWGERGFIRLASGDTCGVKKHAFIAAI